MISKEQLKQLLDNLPQSCAADAAEGINPPLSSGMARFALLQLEEQGVIEWKRDAPQHIRLIKKVV